MNGIYKENAYKVDVNNTENTREKNWREGGLIKKCKDKMRYKPTFKKTFQLD
jgi:hypothetical protein